MPAGGARSPSTDAAAAQVVQVDSAPQGAPKDARARHERSEELRAARLLDAQRQAARLFAAVEQAGILRPGATDLAASDAVRDLAAGQFAVARHWHKRIVRSGPNTLRPYQDEATDRVMTEDDIAFADFGPIFAGWEADFGRTWVLGNDPLKHRMCADLERVFAAAKGFFAAHAQLTAAALYAEVVRLSGALGWTYGNYHCGHLVGEFPHENFAGEKVRSLITAANPAPLRCRDASGRTAHWILEVHLVDPARQIGAFYEELLTL